MSCRASIVLSVLVSWWTRYRDCAVRGLSLEFVNGSLSLNTKNTCWLIKTLAPLLLS